MAFWEGHVLGLWLVEEFWEGFALGDLDEEFHRVVYVVAGG
jgi:hypothetical protein